jgi:hypothetical protein
MVRRERGIALEGLDQNPISRFEAKHLEDFLFGVDEPWMGNTLAPIDASLAASIEGRGTRGANLSDPIVRKVDCWNALSVTGAGQANPRAPKWRSEQAELRHAYRSFLPLRRG